MDWPRREADLVTVQERLAAARPPRWTPGDASVAVGGCFVCFARGADPSAPADEPAWAAAALVRPDRSVVTAAITGRAVASYAPGLLALREGPLLDAAVRALPEAPDVLLVNATGRDHPRRAGLALHLGAVLDLPTVGVTDRPLTAEGPWPAARHGASAPLLLGGAVVGHWLRTSGRARPLAVHAAWRTDPDVALEVVRAACRRVRTPEPLRRARRAARRARSGRA